MSEIPADYLSVRVQPPRQLLGFQEAHHDGRLAYAFGTPIERCPIQGALEAAWWRRGWRQAFAEARVAAALEGMDEAERRELEMDPEFNWEGHPAQHTTFSPHEWGSDAESRTAKLAASGCKSSPQGAMPAGMSTTKASASKIPGQGSPCNLSSAAAESEPTLSREAGRC